MQIEWEPYVLRTETPFGIARWTHQHYPRVLIEVSDGTHTGFGEAAPNAFYGETQETVLAVLPHLREKIPDDAWAWDDFANAAEAAFPKHHRSAKAAIESALLDLAGKQAHLSVRRMLGLASTSVPTSITVGIGATEEIKAQVRNRIQQGYAILKIKLGTPNDEAVLAAIREEAPDACLRVDANAAWTAKQAIQKLSMLESYGVELLEQPVASDDHEGLARVTQASRIPVVADESFTDARDLRHLRCDAINVKLSKVGGPRQAMQAMQTAHALGFGVMLGCMIESSLGIAAAAHIASLADWLDLDGPLLLAFDPFEGVRWDEAKHPVLSPSPGLGIVQRPA